jgi:cytochrome c oxidase cbb3-type subunit III
MLAFGAAVLVAQQASPPPPAASPVTPPPAAAPPRPAPAKPSPTGAADYQERPPADPALLQRGHQIFSANCSFCHGSDARGGEGGPNLIRSQLVLDDQDGERIQVVVQNGRPDKGMPKFDLSAEEIKAIATYLHSIPVGGRAATTGQVDALVGNAQAGEAYFKGAGKCTACHSPTGDLAGIGAKYTDIRALQSAMVSGETHLRPTPLARKTVTVTLPNGQKLEGRLYHVDDFLVSFVDANGNYHSIVRNGDVPRVEVKDPLQPHIDMLGTWKDDDIHNVTAYLVTLK